MIKRDICKALLVASIISISPLSAGAQGTPMQDSKDYKKALTLFERGMYDRSRAMFESLPNSSEDVLASGYSVLCSSVMQSEGYEHLISAYKDKFPGSTLINRINLQHALNLFEAGDYAASAAKFAEVSEAQLESSQVTQFLFKKAYSDFALGKYDSALEGFTRVEATPHSVYLAPARYALGYINYDKKNFVEAEKWFRFSQKDSRFKEISQYYLVECRFMQEDYQYVVSNAPKMMASCPQDRKQRLARIISESYLVLGDTKAAHEYYQSVSTEAPKTRSDFFYAGSLLYAIGDYKGAIENYTNMKDRSDSLGQIANYQMAYSHIRTKNKVAAMETFKSASATSYDDQIAEDAFFNYAKLAFDLNDDASAFTDYIKKYSDKDKGPLIYNYMAVAALRNRDYDGAIENYDKIEDLDNDMVLNYMKANYLRAGELIKEKAYRKAITHLKTAAYFSDKRSGFNQLTRYWLAESHFRNSDYKESRALYLDLYNTSALYGMQESMLLSYNIAYCDYKSENYHEAIRWFNTYLSEKNGQYRKEAMERLSDSYFILKDYKKAAASYQAVVDNYFSADDIYPYYQAGLSYGLAGNDKKKVELLSNVNMASKDAKFYQEAKYELGRAYVKVGDETKARDVFNQILAIENSSFAAQSLIELGMIERNRNNADKAIAYYKRVVEQMPMSEYADDALLAIESIYQSKNEPETYLAYIESIGKSSLKTEDEREQMIFNAAEQIFLSGDYAKALASLQNYETKYPNGVLLSKAHFYTAESYKQLGNLESACDFYSKVITNGSGSFVEIAMLNFANISYSLQEYDEAYTAYSNLYDKALLDDNKYTALKGMMNSTYAGKDYHRSVKYAQQVAADRRSDDFQVLKARYIEAKSYLAISDRTQAFKILEELALDPKSAEGAEATLLIIQDFYDKGEFTKVEEKVYEFSDAGTPQVYFLAKSFIILGDSFVERGEFEQAKATFESVRDGYTPSEKGDDVLEEVKMRLDKLVELMSQPSAQ